MKPRVEIEYCTQCRWLLRAAWMAQELLPIAARNGESLCFDVPWPVIVKDLPPIVPYFDVSHILDTSGSKSPGSRGRLGYRTL